MQLFMEPKSVVLIGAPRRSGPGAYNNLEVMERFGYPGTIYVVHPKVESICGLRTYPDIDSLPEAPDLAVISVGRDRVLAVFDACVRRGIKQVIVISQGFSDADSEGKRLQAELRSKAKKTGVQVVGPNTMGVLNSFAGFSTAFVDIPRETPAWPLGLVAQSGVLQVGFESFVQHVGKAVDLGNMCDVDFVDALEYFEQDPQIRMVAVHMEGVQRGREFLQVAGRLARTKPVVVFKTGRSEAGAKAALSHTGSLVGADEVADSAFRQHGILRVSSMAELLAACKAFLHLPIMRGPNLSVITAAGASGIMAADACEDFGLQLAPFPESLRGSLENERIAWHRLHNPVDIWPLGMVTGSFTRVFQTAAQGLLADPGTDAILGIAPVMRSALHSDLDLEPTLREVLHSAEQPKPLALWLYGDGAREQEEKLDAMPGVACFSSIDEAVMGLAAMYRYARCYPETPHRG